MMKLELSVIDRLRKIVGKQDVLDQKEDLIPYSFDGTAALKQHPGCVVFTRTTVQVSEVLKLANDEGIPVVTRGSGYWIERRQFTFRTVHCSLHRQNETDFGVG